MNCLQGSRIPALAIDQCRVIWLHVTLSGSASRCWATPTAHCYLLPTLIPTCSDPSFLPALTHHSFLKARRKNNTNPLPSYCVIFNMLYIQITLWTSSSTGEMSFVAGNNCVDAWTILLLFYIFYLYWNIRPTFGHRPFFNVVQFSHITLATYLSNPW